MSKKEGEDSIHNFAKKIESMCEKYTLERAKMFTELVCSIDIKSWNRKQFITIVKEFESQVFGVKGHTLQDIHFQLQDEVNDKTEEV